MVYKYFLFPVTVVHSIQYSWQAIEIHVHI